MTAVARTTPRSQRCRELRYRFEQSAPCRDRRVRQTGHFCDAPTDVWLGLQSLPARLLGKRHAGQRRGLDGAEPVQRRQFLRRFGLPRRRAGSHRPVRLRSYSPVPVFQFSSTNTGNIDNARFAPQLIVGTGGTLLDADCTTGGHCPMAWSIRRRFHEANMPFMVQQGDGVASTTPSSTFSQDGFAFAVLNSSGRQGWPCGGIRRGHL